jgi:small subunit ribosomal protein S5
MSTDSSSNSGRKSSGEGGGRKSSGEGGRRSGGEGGRRGGGEGGRRGGESGRKSDLIEKVIKIRRCAAVVKGGRRFSFNGMVVVGNGRGKVGAGYGRANEVPPAVDKAVKDGERSMVTVPLEGSTIAHAVKGHFGASDVVLLPASPGTGVIAGAAVRAVCEAAGIHDVLSKNYGSTNPINVVKATLDALSQLRTQQDVVRLRGVPLP